MLQRQLSLAGLGLIAQMRLGLLHEHGHVYTSHETDHRCAGGGATTVPRVGSERRQFY